METAPTTVITFDLYGKLCGLSSKFKELFNKGQQEQPTQQPAYAAAGGFSSASQPTVQPTAPSSAAQAEKPVFCGRCGAKNARGIKFCGSCGAPIQ